jgi:hypothetical protein
MNKRREIPTLLGLIIIAVAIVIFFGGTFTYEHFAIKEFERVIKPENQTTGFPMQILATKGWKTYTNTQYGFEIKYPSEFEREGQPNENDNLSLIVNNKDQNNSVQWIRMGIAFGMKGVYSFGDFGIDYNSKQVIPGNKNITIYKIPAISDKKSVTFVSIGAPTPAIDVMSLVQKDSNLIIIEIYGSPTANVGDLEKLSDQMLSTFKFTK